MKNISKTLVKDFFFQVKAKAFEALMKEHRIEREVFAQKYLAEKCATRVVEALKRMDGCATALKQDLKVIMSDFGGRHYDTNIHFPNRSFKEIFFSFPIKSSEESIAMFERQAQALDQLKVEYAKIEKNLLTFRNGKYAAEYLESLGFDVSWIRKHSEKDSSATVVADTIDTSVLFPCKKQGLDE